MPEAVRGDVAVLMLSPGIKMRVGPHGLYNRMAESLVRRGLPVLRFDFHGLGDSEGELSESRTPEVYNAIQDGRYVADTRAAMEFMGVEYGYQWSSAAGLCCGAITGCPAAEQDERINGLLSLGIPVSFEGGVADYGRFLTEGELSVLQTGYVRNLRDPKRWLRLLTFRSDFRVIFKVLRRMIRDRLGRAGESTAPTPPVEKEALANTNPKFPPAFFDLLRRRCPMLLVFGGTDRWNWEFEEKFRRVYAEQLRAYPDGYDLVVVPEANHIFSRPHWRDEMQRHVDTWLDRHFPEMEAGR
jgi:pimeloyl-ACP methyl ester carboxylesterase